MDPIDQKTIWCGNISEKVTEEILYELFLQVAPIQRVKIPKDKDGRMLGYAFIILKHEESVKYSIELLNGISLYDKKILLKTRNSNFNSSPNIIREVNQRQPQTATEVIDPRKLIMLGEQMRLTNNIPTSSDNYGGRHHFSNNSRWDRSNSYREDKRVDSYPYRYDNSRSSSSNHNNRRSYDNGSNYHGNSRNRRRH